MGRVYRARDSRLNRDVALKVLPETFAVDASRVARFEREAQLLASLNHPGIAAIYGVEHSDKTPVLVLELVEGVTLADRLAAGPLALDDVLRVAQQMAIALEAAHEKGVVHRDLKPANIMVTDRGQVKVLDFGLAKMLEPEGDSTPFANLPTMSLRATRAGEILGTAAYMSPEQARGRALDRRTDVWSFGCVLFEMLTGASPFSASTASDIIAAILKREPEWNGLPADTPRSIERLLKRCLVKDQALRLRDMGDAQLEIADALDGTPAERPGVVSSPASKLRVLAWPIAAVALSLLTFVLTRTYFASPGASSPVIHSTIPWPAIPAGGVPTGRSAISPDGRAVAFIGTESAPESRLVWVRAFDTPTPRPLQGTQGADTLFWSADSRFVGFFADRKLKRVAIAGGSPFTMCQCSSYAGTWSKDGVILFRHGDVIARISDAGGMPAPVSVLDREKGETHHEHPVFLPDGRHFIFLAFRGLQVRGTFIGALDSNERVPLIEGAANTTYARGFVLFVKGTALMAQAFEPVKRVLVGDARPLVEQISILPDGTGSFSAAKNADMLIYSSDAGGVSRRRHFEWHDRTGKRLQTIGPADDYWDAHLSQDGRYLSVSVGATGSEREIWIIDALRNTRAPFTDDPGSAYGQAWSGDGTRVAYMSTRNGRYDLYEKVVATEHERVLITGGTQKFVHDWSNNDRYLIYTELGESASIDLWVLPLAGNSNPIAFQQTRANENFAQFSPDTKWIAFQSDESGAWEVYVAPFPGPGRRVRVSNKGGVQPRWRSDGRELFYRSPAGQLMAVDVKTAAGTFDASKPKSLFELSGQWTGRWRYDVSPDGQRFLVGREDTEGVPAMSLIMNWPELLRH
jgi:eukaryotic-like serine/threonine-protein kinase